MCPGPSAKLDTAEYNQLYFPYAFCTFNISRQFCPARSSRRRCPSVCVCVCVCHLPSPGAGNVFCRRTADNIKMYTRFGKKIREKGEKKRQKKKKTGPERYIQLLRRRRCFFARNTLKYFLLQRVPLSVYTGV